MEYRTQRKIFVQFGCLYCAWAASPAGASANAANPAILLPGPIAYVDVKTRAEGPNPYANYSVVRLKSPLTPGSYVGFIATDKESGSPTDPHNRAGGVDAKFVLFRNLNLRGYYAKTWTPGLHGENAAGGVLPTFYSLSGEAIAIPEQFRSAVRSIVKGANCSRCSHRHYVNTPLQQEKTNWLCETQGS